MRYRTAILAAASLLGCVLAQTATAAPSEYDVKAALVFKIAKFLAWPAAGAREPESFALCYVGDAAAGRSFDALTRERLTGRAVNVTQLASDGDPRDCQILYITLAREAATTEMLRIAAEHSILTIGESAAFASRLGGVMALRTDAKRVRFEINLLASRRAGLQINSQLLNLATIVGRDDATSASQMPVAPARSSP